jgi:hypothetical protein
MGLTTTPFFNLFAFLPPPKSQAFSFNGCLYGCSDSRSQFQLFSFPRSAGTNSYTETLHQDTGKMATNTHDATNNFTREESPAGLRESTSMALTESAGSPVEQLVQLDPSVVGAVDLTTGGGSLRCPDALWLARIASHRRMTPKLSMSAACPGRRTEHVLFPICPIRRLDFGAGARTDSSEGWHRRFPAD